MPRYNLKVLKRDLRTVLNKSSRKTRFGEETTPEKTESFWKRNKGKIKGALAVTTAVGLGALAVKNKKLIAGRLQPGAMQKTIDRKLNNRPISAKQELKNTEAVHDYAKEAGFELFFGKRRKNKTRFGKTRFGESSNQLAEKVEYKIEQLPPKKQNLIKKYLIKLLVAIGYKIGDLLDFTLKQIIALVIKHFGKLVLAAIMFHYGIIITKGINKKVSDVGDRFNKK